MVNPRPRRPVSAADAPMIFPRPRGDFIPVAPGAARPAPPDPRPDPLSVETFQIHAHELQVGDVLFHAEFYDRVQGEVVELADPMPQFPVRVTIDTGSGGLRTLGFSLSCIVEIVSAD